MADLGDISNFMKDGNVSNLEWLDVSEAEYQKREVLPHQNLDVVPDLEALWNREGEASTKLVPNREREPRTMGDLSDVHGLLRANPEEIRKVARLALMQSYGQGRQGFFASALRARFDSGSLQAASEILREVSAEHGLLGKFYIDASDFPNCASGSKKPAEFVKRYASGALFVKTKAACAGCVHSMSSPTGGQNCATFHKELKVEVPYTETVADAVERTQQSKGKAVQAMTGDPRARIKAACLAFDGPVDHPVAMPKPKEAVLRLLRPVEAPIEAKVAVDLTRPKKAATEAVSVGLREGKIPVQKAQQFYKAIAAAQTVEDVDKLRHAASMGEAVPPRVYQGMGEQPALATVSETVVAREIEAAGKANEQVDVRAKYAVAQRKAQPIVDLLRREMLKGRSEPELQVALRSAFSPSALDESAPFWYPLFRQAGVYGVVYSHQESFDTCHEGADFLAKHNPTVKAIVKGSKCAGCIYGKVGRCLIYGKKLVESIDTVVNPEMVSTVLADHKAAGRIAPWDQREWGSTSYEALQNLHKAASLKAGPSVGQTRDTVVTAFRGQMQGHNPNSVTRRNIVKAAREYMNEGLYGSDLLTVLKSRFEARDLTAATTDLKPVIAEQGLQGVYFVDPTVYDDYGKGCERAASLHRSRGVPYAKFGEKCSSCVLQTRPGYCSKLNKPLVAEPPYSDKAAQQREILASGRSTEVKYEDIVNNGHSMMAEYQVQQREMDVEIDPVIEVQPFDISFK